MLSVLQDLFMFLCCRGDTRPAEAFTKSIAYKLSRDFSFSSFPGA